MTSEAVAAPVRQRLADTSAPQHLVGFYETDTFLVDSVVAFLGPAVDVGEAAVVVATPAHGTQLQEALTRRGLDVAVAIERDQLIVLDAAQLLADVMVGDTPDTERFESLFGPVLDRARHGGRQVRIFGEVSALLWADGHLAAARTLEGLGSHLTATQGHTMLCMYPTSAVDSEEDTLAFLTMCEQHDAVIPSENYSALPTLDDRLRQVTLLQQEAFAARTDRLASRRQQDTLEAQLARLRELEHARNELMGMAAHDVRSPAAAITGLLGLLKDADLGPDQQWAVTTAIANANRIGRLADDLLSVSALESGHVSFALRPVDLAQVIEQTAAEVGAATGRHIHTTCPSDLPPALADQDRQAQILSNLLTNAVKFSPEGGTVRVEVAARDDHLVVDVHDDGIGMSPTQLERVFQPFSQLSKGDKDDSRTGLGLYITKKLVDGQGGQIWADSIRTEGSTFTYTVPIAGP